MATEHVCRGCGRRVKAEAMSPEGRCRDRADCDRARRKGPAEPPPAGSWGPAEPGGPQQGRLF